MDSRDRRGPLRTRSVTLSRRYAGPTWGADPKATYRDAWKGIVVRTRLNRVGATARRPRMSRRGTVSVGLAIVAGSGAFASALILNGQSHINLAANASRAHQVNHSHAASRFVFSTLDNSNDPTFNQLLGINNRGVIAGYFGSGAQGHPNKGYQLVLSRHGSRFRNENFPHSVQTQVTGLNGHGVTVGFWSDMNNVGQMNDNFGFYAVGGRFHKVNYPTTHNASPPVNQLLGVNNANIAVGFYTDAKGNNHGYRYNIGRHKYRSITIRGAKSLTAAAISNMGDVAGFFTGSGGVTKAFLMRPGGHTTKLAYPRAMMTQALGVNDAGEVVGAYQTGSGNNAKMHGFTWTSRHGFRTVDDPHGRGATTINGVNDAGDLVGFYADAMGNTHGLLYARAHYVALPAPPVPMSMPMPSEMPTKSAMAMTTQSAKPTMSPTLTPVPMSSSSAPPHW